MSMSGTISHEVWFSRSTLSWVGNGVKDGVCAIPSKIYSIFSSIAHGVFTREGLASNWRWTVENTNPLAVSFIIGGGLVGTLVYAVMNSKAQATQDAAKKQEEKKKEDSVPPTNKDKINTEGQPADKKTVSNTTTTATATSPSAGTETTTTTTTPPSAGTETTTTTTTPPSAGTAPTQELVIEGEKSSSEKDKTEPTDSTTVEEKS